MRTKITSFSKDTGKYKVSFYRTPEAGTLIYFNDNKTIAYVSEVNENVCTLKKCSENMDFESLLKVGSNVKIFWPHKIV